MNFSLAAKFVPPRSKRLLVLVFACCMPSASDGSTQIHSQLHCGVAVNIEWCTIVHHSIHYTTEKGADCSPTKNETWCISVVTEFELFVLQPVSIGRPQGDGRNFHPGNCVPWLVAVDGSATWVQNTGPCPKLRCAISFYIHNTQVQNFTHTPLVNALTHVEMSARCFCFWNMSWKMHMLFSDSIA